MEIKKFIKVLFFITLGILVSDRIIGGGLKYLYANQKSGLLYRTSYAIDHTTADYIVLGSSRANHNYDPKVFETFLKSSFYNCGRDKQGLLYSSAVLSAILKRYKPKCIIIDIRPDEFTQFDEGTLATLLPYQNNMAIRPYLKFNSRFEDLKLMSHIYPYNSLLTNLIVGINENWSDDYKGYIKLTSFNKDDKLDSLTENLLPDTVKIKAFQHLTDQIDQLNIPAYLVISPIHYKYTSSITTEICASITKKNRHFTFLNFLNKTAWQNNRYYSDNNHLNYIGAARFSEEIVQHLVSAVTSSKAAQP